MRNERLLWVAADTNSGNFAEWREHFNEFDVNQVSHLDELRQAITDRQADCVLITGTLPEVTHLEALETIQSLDAGVPVIFCENELTVAAALQLIRAGAFHCFGRLEDAETIRDYVDRAIDEQRHRRKVTQRTASSEAWRSHLVGESPEMESVTTVIRQIGPRRSTVLITGETGTGKEVVAKAIHMAGPRASQPFVAINCSALPENLLEAELFGHVKGAFTGAMNHRVGRFEQANKGTIFLDEIGEMPLEMQAKLLRVLQEREIQRLGGSETIKVDVRVIAATNRDLLERVRQGLFREDLYYRLNVVPIHVPSLRQRVSDIPVLVHHFVKRVCASEGLTLRRLTPEAMDRLKANAWPGNVRQLENAVEKAIVLSGDRDVLTPADFGLSTAPRPKLVSLEPVNPTPEIPEGMRFDAAVSRFEAKMLFTAMEKTGGNKTAAAELLGLKRTTLIMKLRNLETSSADSSTGRVTLTSMAG